MSKKVKIGNLTIGGGESIKIQSMSTFRPADLNNAIRQALEVEKAGCDIFRFSVSCEEDAMAFKKIKKEVKMPLVADIHFDYKLALKSIEGGADKVRINPGNIGSEANVLNVARALIDSGIPVRVGSNSGSIEKEFLNKYGKSEVALGESALDKVRILEKYGVNNIVISVKASSVALTVKAYEYIAKRTDYPLHLGVTEAGTENMGIIKNACAYGALLLRGIGDTVRVSLSAPPKNEVLAGIKILKAMGLKKGAGELVACPTCGRCEWNCIDFAKETEEFLEKSGKDLKVAVMGCAVNGPGEAKDADLGVAGAGGGECVIFKKGVIVKRIDQKDLKDEFFGEIEKWRV